MNGTDGTDSGHSPRRSEVPATTERCPPRGTMNWKEAGERFRKYLVRLHYARTTVKSYMGWARQFWRFWKTVEPGELEVRHFEAFLQDLAEVRKVAATTQNQALNAIVMFYRHGLEREVGELQGITRARSSKHLPNVLSAQEARQVMEHLDGVPRLIAGIQLGGGLRLKEALTGC